MPRSSALAARSPPRWQTQFAESWLTRRHGSITVLFNPYSADTHLLNDLAMELLGVLRKSPATLEELVQQMGAQQDDTEARATLARLIQELDHLGLVALAP